LRQRYGRRNAKANEVTPFSPHHQLMTSKNEDLQRFKTISKSSKKSTLCRFK